MSDSVTDESFLRSVSGHVMTILEEDGVHRRIRFSKPGSTDMHFFLVTWPGYLCYCGDMGTFVFQRLDDMFAFFRSGRQAGKLAINTGYWGEKCVAVDDVDGIREYSADSFRDVVKEWLAEQLEEFDDDGYKGALTEAVDGDLLAYADDGEAVARRAADDFEFIWNDKRFAFTDFWETTLTVKTNRFLWCCYAIAWGIQKYDEWKASEVARVEG
jgi:hypothetical protein